jgi:hypothetical protein
MDNLKLGAGSLLFFLRCNITGMKVPSKVHIKEICNSGYEELSAASSSSLLSG